MTLMQHRVAAVAVIILGALMMLSGCAGQSNTINSSKLDLGPGGQVLQMANGELITDQVLPDGTHNICFHPAPATSNTTVSATPSLAGKLLGGTTTTTASTTVGITNTQTPVTTAAGVVTVQGLTTYGCLARGNGTLSKSAAAMLIGTVAQAVPTAVASGSPGTGGGGSGAASGAATQVTVNTGPVTSPGGSGGASNKATAPSTLEQITYGLVLVCLNGGDAMMTPAQCNTLLTTLVKAAAVLK